MNRFFRAVLAAFVLLASSQITEADADLLTGIRIEPEATADYNRQRDYGGWLRMNEPYDRCFNVRDQVLEDEGTRTKFRYDQPLSGWRCKVASGLWKDPYTGRRITDPAELDIDHLVPLKEAHLSGAHRWLKEKRKEYANFLRDPWHLMAVSLGENRSKGDKDPAKYMPPRAAFHCAYLRRWVEVKRRWDLSMDQVEADFVRAKLAPC